MTRKNVVWAVAAVAATVGLGAVAYVKRAFLKDKSNQAWGKLKERAGKLKEELSSTANSAPAVDVDE